MAQLINFVEHMASAHSWYKHLANCAPRDFFQVRVSPTAGMRHHVTGRFVDYVEDDGTRFHYTWMTTARYRARFWFLDYEFSGYFDSTAPSATVCTVDGESALLPRALREDLVPVTATVHSNSLHYGLFHTAWEASETSQLTPSRFTSRMSRRAVDDDLSNLPPRARAHAEQSVAAVAAMRRWFDAREGDQRFCAAQRAVRVVWGAEAASALGDVPRECALRSMSP